MDFITTAAGSALAMGILVAYITLSGRWRRLRARVSRLERVETDVLRLRQRMYGHVAMEELRAAGRPARMPLEFRSEFGEDLVLWDLFGGGPPGVFVECGAFDGYDLSVTYAFEAAGWTGVLIEALPERAAQCRSRRPGSTVVHAAVGAPGGPPNVTFTVAEGPGLEMLSHAAHEGMGAEHVRTIQKKGGRTRQIQVPLRTMDSILGEVGVTRIDFAVLDVEGGELALLRGFDLARFAPRALMVEDNSMGRRTDVADHLRARGYEQVMWVGLNRLFIDTRDAALLAKARALANRVDFRTVKA